MEDNVIYNKTERLGLSLEIIGNTLVWFGLGMFIGLIYF